MLQKIMQIVGKPQLDPDSSGNCQRATRCKLILLFFVLWLMEWISFISTF